MPHFRVRMAIYRRKIADVDGTVEYLSAAARSTSEEKTMEDRLNSVSLLAELAGKYPDKAGLVTDKLLQVSEDPAANVVVRDAALMNISVIADTARETLDPAAILARIDSMAQSAPDAFWISKAGSRLREQFSSPAGPTEAGNGGFLREITTGRPGMDLKH